MDDAKLLEAERRGMETGFFAGIKAFLAGKPTVDESGDKDKEKEKESKDSDEIAELKKEIAELKAALAKAKGDTADDDDEDDKDKKKGETGDSATLDAATVSELVSTANIINPGYKPTADVLKSPLALKRDILAKAYTADAKKDGVAVIIEDFVGQSPNFATIDEATASAALVGTGGLVRSMNNARLVGGLLAPGRTTDAAAPDKRFSEASANLWKV